MTTVRRIRDGLVMAGLLAFSVQGQAEIVGEYVSEGEDECVLTITEIDLPEPRFGDAYYQLESRGLAACMWSGVGMSTSTHLAGATISVPPTNNRVFLRVEWLFGPASPTINLRMRSTDDGKVLVDQNYARQ